MPLYFAKVEVDRVGALAVKPHPDRYGVQRPHLVRVLIGADGEPVLVRSLQGGDDDAAFLLRDALGVVRRERVGGHVAAVVITHRAIILDRPGHPYHSGPRGGRRQFILAVAAIAGQRSGYIGAMTTVHVPYTVEQDEDGVWCAHAWLGSSGGANGNGATAEEAIADLREAVRMVIEEDGIPAQLARSLDLDVA
jgi:hypothetical protein